MSAVRLLVSANVVPSTPIIFTQMIEVVGSSDTSVLRRTAWRNIPEDGIFYSHRHENLKSYDKSFVLTIA
jgi:hypothetical protein